jgi:hypothetical protein
MLPKKILHYGLNRSGTNFLKELLLKHFQLIFINREDERSHPLHKHFRLYDDKELIGRPNFKNNILVPDFKAFENLVQEDYSLEADLIVVISKDPYSWNLSYGKWGRKNKWESSPHPYILEYNEFHRKWLQFSKETDKIRMIRYIDLLVACERILDELHEDFEFSLKKPLRTGRPIRKVPMSRKFSSRRMKYYTDEAYLDSYSSNELRELNQHLDHEVASALGYNIHEISNPSPNQS